MAAYLLLINTIHSKPEEVGGNSTVQKFKLEEVNEALDALRSGKIKGDAVIVLDEDERELY